MQSTNEEMIVSEDEEELADQNEPSENIAKQNMIALNLQNEAEEEEEIDHFIGKLVSSYFSDVPNGNIKGVDYSTFQVLICCMY